MSMNDLARIIFPGTYVIYIDKNDEVISLCNDFDYEECPYKSIEVIDISVGSNKSLMVKLDIVVGDSEDPRDVLLKLFSVERSTYDSIFNDGYSKGYEDGMESCSSLINYLIEKSCENDEVK